MKLSILVAVIIGLFAIYWAVSCLVGILGSIGMVGMMFSGGLSGVLQAAIPFVVPIVYGTMAFFAWVFADGISLRVVGQKDPN